MIGYTMYMQQSNKSASAKSLGVKFGRHCIKNNISVAKLAGQFGKKHSQLTIGAILIMMWSAKSAATK